MDNKKIRWGIIGTGNIANSFAEGLASAENAEITAVASRTLAAADSFGDKYGIAGRCIGAAQLAGRSDVDAVYVATPHPMHKQDTLDCIAGGKAVLCEKPFSMNAAEASAMIKAARKKKVFLMEAMWTNFFPAMQRVREIIASGSIGEVRLVQSNFCFRAGFNPESRLFSPALGGGALLDVGIYNVSLARMVFGKKPSRISSMAELGSTGVDEQSAVIMGYDGGAMAVLTCAVRTGTGHEAAIYGTEGHIKIPHMFWRPQRIILAAGAEPEREISFELKGNGYNYEADHVGTCLRKGLLESSVVPLAVTLENMQTLDLCRRQWKLVYPMERK